MQENCETNNNPFENGDFKEEKNTDENIEEIEEKGAGEPQEVSELDKVKSELEDLNNKYIRLMADFDNYRKRQAQERENLLKYGASEVLKKILTVLDNIERAKKTCENVDCPETLKNSFEVVVKNLIETLQKCGLEKINAEGCIFDPNIHDAVIQTPTNDYDEHTIIAELQAGYKLGDSVLRPTLVNVATKPDEEK